MNKKTSASPKKLRTSLHTIFATDKHKEEDGAWITVNDLRGLKIKVRRLKSDASQKAYERIVREMFGEGSLRTPTKMTTDDSINVFKRQLAEGVLVDWDGLQDEETGEEIPYSLELATELMELDDFRDFVAQAAGERDTFREELDEEAVKN